MGFKRRQIGSHGSNGYSLRNVGEVLGWTNRVPIAIDSMEEGRMGPRRNIWPQEGGR